MNKELQQQANAKRAQAKCFLKLIMHLPTFCIESLLDVESMLSKVYIVDNIESRARQPSRSELPWPLLLMATAFNRKHIFPVKSFDERKMEFAIREFSNKLAWTWFFKNEDRDSLSSLRSKIGKGPTRACNKVIPNELVAIISEVRKVIAKCCKQSKFIHAPAPTFFTKTCVSLLRDSPWLAMETDKDGGFAFIDRGIWKIAKLKALGNGDYSHSSPNKRATLKQYGNLCKRAQKVFDQPGLCSVLAKSLSIESAKMESSLVFTCKTHKPVVSFRNIHASSQWCFKGLGVFVSDLIQRKLNTYPHIIRNSKHFVEVITKLKYKPTQKICKLDIEHFFMSGQSHELADLATRICDTEHADLQELLHDMILFLTDNQYIQDGQSTYKVEVGTGMGLPHSGAVAEASILCGSERELVKQIGQYDIDLYVRFKDDILCVFNNSDLMAKFVSKLKQGHPFSIVCDEVSSKGAKFLDVEVMIRNGKYQTRPTDKASKLAVPLLASTSAHPNAIHKSWPVSHLRNRLSLCSSSLFKLEYARLYYERAKRSHLHPTALHGILCIIGNLESKTFSMFGRMLHGRSGSRPHTAREIWLVCPFYPVFAKAGLARRVSNFLESNVAVQAISRAFGSYQVSIRFGFRNTSRNIAGIFRLASSRTGGVTGVGMEGIV